MTGVTSAGVASANFKFSKNSLFNIALLKSNYIVSEVTSAFCYNIPGGILICVTALFGFKPLFSLLTSDSITCSKRKVLVIFASFFLIVKNNGVELIFYDNFFNWIFSIFSYSLLIRK